MMPTKLQLLCHVGDHERLADGLPAINAQGTVAVCVGAISRLDEGLARDLLHGAKHRLIADPATPKRKLKHHLFWRILNCGHVAPSNRTFQGGSSVIRSGLERGENIFANRGSR